MKKKISIIEIMKRDKDEKVLQKINASPSRKAIFESMIKLEKMGIYLSDYECFRFCDFYTGEKQNKSIAS